MRSVHWRPGQPSHDSSTGNDPLDQIIRAGYAAFTSALHDALYLSAGLLAGAALLSAVTLRQPPPGRRLSRGPTLDCEGESEFRS